MSTTQQVSALLLVGVGAVLTWWILSRRHRHSRSKLERSQRQAASIVRLTLGTAAGADLNVALRDITESAARVLGVEYASVWLMDQAGIKLHCAVEFNAASMSHGNGMAIAASECASYLSLLSMQRSLACEDVGYDARFTELNRCYPPNRRIAATLDASVGVAGKMVGVVRHQSTKTRAWQEDEIAFVCAVADYVSHVLLLEQRKKAEAELERQQKELARLSEAAKLAELSGSLAHELNQPLTAILINAQAGEEFLKSGKMNDEELRALLGDIASDAQRAADVMRRLRAMYLEAPRDSRNGPVQARADE